MHEPPNSCHHLFPLLRSVGQALKAHGPIPVPIVGDDDDPVLLDEVDEPLELVQLRLDLLPPHLLGQRVSQQRQLLVHMLEVRPVCSEALFE